MNEATCDPSETLGGNQSEVLRELQTHCGGCSHGSACMGGMCSDKKSSAQQKSHRVPAVGTKKEAVKYGTVREFRDAYKFYCISTYCSHSCLRVSVGDVSRPFNHRECHHCSLLMVYELGGGYDL